CRHHRVHRRAGRHVGPDHGTDRTDRRCQRNLQRVLPDLPISLRKHEGAGPCPCPPGSKSMSLLPTSATTWGDDQHPARSSWPSEPLPEASVLSNSEMTATFCAEGDVSSNSYVSHSRTSFSASSGPITRAPSAST